MIGRIHGKLLEKHPPQIVVDVQGVGCELDVSMSTFYQLPATGAEVTLYTHLAVREDALDLYGFAERESLQFFELLIKISGIGPKSAMNILSVASLDSLKEAVGTGDVAYLTKISGIGKKTAEKIILELRDKLPASSSPASSLQSESDALEALESLGYGRKEAHDALRKVPAGGASPSTSLGASERVREALKILGKHG